MLPTAPAASNRTPAGTPAADLEILLISLGNRSFGVPLPHVRYVAPMPGDFRNAGADTERHFVFEGEPLAYVSLWNTLSLPSTYAEFAELQAMLPQRRQDHLDWMSALEDALRTGAAFAKARNPRECAFGKWYYAHTTGDRRLNLLMSQFEQPHAEIHGLADKLLGLAESGQREEALHAYEDARNTTLSTLMRLFDTAQQLVVELQRRVAVILEDGDDRCALGVDAIKDIVVVPAQQVKPGGGRIAGAAAPATAALLILDDHQVVPLLNWQGFCAAAG